MNTTEKGSQPIEQQLQWAGTGGGAGSKGALLGQEAGQGHSDEEQRLWPDTGGGGGGGGAGSKGAMLGEETGQAQSGQ